MLVIFAIAVVVVSLPAAMVFYSFTRAAAISEAEQFAGEAADRRIIGLNYTLRLATASLSRFELMLRDALAPPPTGDEGGALALALERTEGGMLATRKNQFNGRQQAGIVIPAELPYRADLWAFHGRVQRLMSFYAGTVVPPLDSMWLLTREQSAVMYVPRDPDFIYRLTPKDTYANTEWLTLGDPATNPERKMSWSHAAYDPQLGTWVVSAVQPLDLGGRWIGTIGHDLFLDWLVKRMVGEDQVPGVEHFLVDAEGNPIIAGSWQEVLQSNQLTGEARATYDETVRTLTAAFDGATENAPVHVSVNGTSSSVLMRTLPETGWRYFVVTPMAGITGSVSRALLLFGLTAAVTMALVIAVAHLLLQRQVVNPIRDLAAAVREFSAGNRESRARVDRADDIGDLGQAFNNMADHITQSHNDLTSAKFELQHRNAALVDANRTKSNFLANMSHELRTPLNAIIGFAEILRHQMFGPLGTPRYVNYVEDIQRSGQHLLSLINDVLDMSRIEAGRQPLHMERQALAPLIERSIRMARPIAEHRQVDLKFHTNGAVVEADCDSRAVTQMVINLVSNAVKFSPNGGTVDISLEKTDQGAARISVSDLGPGIDEELLPHLFEAYAHRAAMTTARTDGVGLGLAITKALVELHKGQIRVVTQPGRGTRMTLELPSPDPRQQR